MFFVFCFLFFVFCFCVIESYPNDHLHARTPQPTRGPWPDLLDIKIEDERNRRRRERVGVKIKEREREEGEGGRRREDGIFVLPCFTTM